MKQRRTIVLSAVFALLVGIFSSTQSQLAERSDRAIFTPVKSISYQFHNHIHGLGYDSENQRLFVATHHGIFVWKEGQLFQLGENRDDFMGFSLNPSDPKIVYTSGHPRSGGNMGVMKSEDGGITFKPIFSGLGRESVDFHSMAISPANSKILYGWFQGKLYRSKDSGQSWQIALASGLPKEGFCFGAPCLTADTKDERVVYAGASGGLFMSRDFGENWSLSNSQLGGVAGVGVSLANSKHLFAFTQNFGLAASQNAGKTWKPGNQRLQLSPGEIVFSFAFDRKNSRHLFAATPEKVFRSTDGGLSWEKIL